MNLEEGVTNLASYKPVLLLALLVVAWNVERFIPAIATTRTNWKQSLINLAIGFFNTTLVISPLAWVVILAVHQVESCHLGLLKQCDAWMPDWMCFLLGIILLDLCMYVWHRMCHTVPYLWRCHALHHSDEQVNATSAFRFHTLELLLSLPFRCVVILIFGISYSSLLTYESIFLCAIVFHHSNIQLPTWLEQWLNRCCITPAAHRRHHSIEPTDACSNYGVVLSLWDRILGSWNRASSSEPEKLGVYSTQSLSPLTLLESWLQPLSLVCRRREEMNRPTVINDDGNEDTFEVWPEMNASRFKARNHEA